MMFEYRTIAQSVSEIILKEKGSKFIGYAFYVGDPEEVKKQLEVVHGIHPKATHHCYAYRMGIEGREFRANDDGEPSGSAGIPIYNQILSHDLTNVLIIVVRYYGGTKLGVSGLVKAYKETAKAVLEHAEIIVKELELNLHLEFPFHLQNSVFTVLNKINAKITSFDSSHQCTIIARTPASQKQNIPELLSGMHLLKYTIVD